MLLKLLTDHQVMQHVLAETQMEPARVKAEIWDLIFETIGIRTPSEVVLFLVMPNLSPEGL